MVEAGVRDLKTNLSRYLRRVGRGESVRVTAHGRTIAEIHPPAKPSPNSRLAELIAAGEARGPVEDGDPMELLDKLKGPKLPRGYVLEALDWLREDKR
jgi:prevent-host-death family protein